jgi:hypothetical protein
MLSMCARVSFDWLASSDCSNFSIKAKVALILAKICDFEVVFRVSRAWKKLSDFSGLRKIESKGSSFAFRRLEGGKRLGYRVESLRSSGPLILLTLSSKIISTSGVEMAGSSETTSVAGNPGTEIGGSREKACIKASSSSGRDGGIGVAIEMRGWGQRDEPIQPANCVVALEVIDK